MSATHRFGATELRRLSRCSLLFAVVALGSLSGSSHAAVRQQLPSGSWGWVDAHQPLTETTWLAHYLLEKRRVSLDDTALNTERFRHPWLAGLPEVAWFERGRFGPRAWQVQRTLNWSAAACEAAPEPDLWRRSNLPLSKVPGSEEAPPSSMGWSAFEFARPAPFRLLDAWLSTERAPEPDTLQVEAPAVCPAYRAPAAVTIIRTDGEHARFRLLECDGAVSAEALDELSVLMRPPGVPRPELPLPNEPAETGSGEWLPGIKLVHPRLVWALERVARAFPWRSIYLMSGYRRDSHGYHPRGRAADIFVHGVTNTELFNFCRTLSDVGCGFYPNNKFVHIDVRDYGTKHPAWVDVAEPGKPSEYVDSWPGINGPDAGARLVDH